MADFGSRVMRTLGPRLKEHNIGRANLVAAFPEKSSAEIDDILRGVWTISPRRGGTRPYRPPANPRSPDPQE